MLNGSLKKRSNGLMKTFTLQRQMMDFVTEPHEILRCCARFWRPVAAKNDWREVDALGPKTGSTGALYPP